MLSLYNDILTLFHRYRSAFKGNGHTAASWMHQKAVYSSNPNPKTVALKFLSANKPEDLCRHIPQPSHRNVCDFIWRNNLRWASVRSAFHLPGKWAKQNCVEEKHQCVWHLHLVPRQAERPEGKAETHRNGRTKGKAGTVLFVCQEQKPLI